MELGSMSSNCSPTGMPFATVKQLKIQRLLVVRAVRLETGYNRCMSRRKTPSLIFSVAACLALVGRTPLVGGEPTNQSPPEAQSNSDGAALDYSSPPHCVP